MSHLRQQSCAAGALFVVLLVATTAAADITGKWHISPLGIADRFVDIVQTGSALSITFTGSSLPPETFAGTITGNDFTVGDPTLCVTLSGRTLPSGNTLDGQLVGVPPCFPNGGKLEFAATRCTCFDGNSTDGDGCSAECEVEPCFTCAGDPSVCTPSADGAACDDGNICTTGETCSAGLCGNGSPVIPCVNLTGAWHLHEVGINFIGQPVVGDSNQTISQRGADLIFNPESPTYVGTIDPATGVFDTRTSSGCILFNSGAFDPLTGTAAADGNSFVASGYLSFDANQSCEHDVDFTVAATRSTCGNGIIETGETCDDNNQVAGDGCDADCQVETCYVCSGAPSVCGFAPNGTSCGPSDACTTTACNGTGMCVTSMTDCDDGDACTVDSCLPALGCGHAPVNCDDGHACTVDSCLPALGCIHTPKTCRTAQRSLLEIGNAARKTLVWKWSQGQSTSPAEFADPRSTATYDLCLFAGTSGALVSEAVIAPSAQWASTGSSGFTYNDPSGAMDGIRKLRLIGSAADRAKIILTGKGAALPGVPLPLSGPITAQLENRSTSVCWSASYDGSQIVQDVQNRLKAKFKIP
jgi:cysteine-rich repeat protein